MKADYLDAKMQSHRGNLQRYARLLATQLTELERDYLHKRIEEGAEVARLKLEQAAKAAQVKKSRYRPQSAVGARRAVYSNLELSARHCGWSCAGCGKGPSCLNTWPRSRQSIQPDQGSPAPCNTL